MAELNLTDAEIDAVREQLAHERLYASGAPLSRMSRTDAICAESYRERHSPDEIKRRLVWLGEIVASGKSRPLHG